MPYEQYTIKNMNKSVIKLRNIILFQLKINILIRLLYQKIPINAREYAHIMQGSQVTKRVIY